MIKYSLAALTVIRLKHANNTILNSFEESIVAPFIYTYTGH